MGVVAVPETLFPQICIRGGDTPSRGVAGGIPLLVPQGPPQDGPPNLGSVAGRSLPTFTDFSDFLGRLFLVIVGVVFTVDYLFTRLHVFFPEIVLRRNWIIKEVVLVEASSIVPLPRRLESY